MIVRMKKYAFLVYHAQYTEFLKKLREVGVLHVSEKPEGIAENDQLREKMILSSRVDKAVKTATTYLDEEMPVEEAKLDNKGHEYLEAFETKVQLLEQNKQQLNTIQREIDRMRVWDEYSYQRIEELKEAGIHLKFYTCMQHKFKQEWIEEYIAIPVATVWSNIYFTALNTLSDNMVEEGKPKAAISIFTGIPFN